MDVIIFCDHEKETQRLVAAVMSAGIDGSVRVYQTLETFLQIVRQFEARQAIHVLAVNDEKTIDALLHEGGLLEGIKIIVVLLDADMKNISKVHRLYPRYVASSKREFKELTAVLDKMAQSTTNYY